MNRIPTIALAVAVIIITAYLTILWFSKNRPHEITFEKPGITKEYQGPKKKILFIYSYHEDWSWDRDVGVGVIDGLASKGFKKDADYELRSFYMDTKLTYITPKQIKERGDEAEKLIENYQPDLVFTHDDNALYKAVVPYLLKHPDAKTPFVFAGINSEPDKIIPQLIDSLDHPGHNVTGRLERIMIQPAIGVMAGLFPEARRIMIVADASESSLAVVKDINSKYTGRDLPIDFVLKEITTFDDWKKTIIDAQAHYDILGLIAYLQLKNGKGEIVPTAEIINWTLANNKLPEMGLLTFHAEDGFFSGIGVSSRKVGYDIGQLGADILNGKNPGDIPIIDPKEFDIAFNLKRAKDLKIKIPVDFLNMASEIF